MRDISSHPTKSGRANTVSSLLLHRDSYEMIMACLNSFMGFSEVEPKPIHCLDDRIGGLSSGSNYYFPINAKRSIQRKSGEDGQTSIAVTIPCYNETGDCLERTLQGLYMQRLPKSFCIDAVIVIDGTKQIDETMTLYLANLFAFDVSLWRDNGIFDCFSEDTNTLILENETPYHHESKKKSSVGSTRSLKTIGQYFLKRNKEERAPTMHLSLIVKRSNQKKVNSQKWALAAHAMATQCEYAFLTDCGTSYDRDCLRRLLMPMLKDPNVGVTSGYQQCMSATMQGNCDREWMKRPGDFFLRQIQTFDFDVSFSIGKSLYSQMKFLPVVPGPCGLYRYKFLGSLENGVMAKYFELSSRKLEKADLFLGNTQLAEDRFPGNLMTLQTKEACANQGLPSPPTVEYVPDAIYFFEAELPLHSLIKQRRRWYNGAFFSALWFLSADWLWNSNQHFLFKMIIFIASVCESILAPIFFVVLVPPTIACVLFGTMNALLSDNLESMLSAPNKDTSFSVHDWRNTSYALIPGIVYMLAYALFIIGHIPRAVKVKTENCLEPKRSTEQPIASSPSRKSSKLVCEEVQWRADRRSAYRAPLWMIGIAVNFLASATILPCVIVALMHHANEAHHIWWLLYVTAASFVAAIVHGMFNYQRPTLKPFLCILSRFFGMLSLGGFANLTWCQAYAFTRISDLTWGNRDGAHEDMANSTVARRRAFVGKVVALTMLATNIAVFVAGCAMTLFWDSRTVVFMTLAMLTPITFSIFLHMCASFYAGGAKLLYLCTQKFNSYPEGSVSLDRIDSLATTMTNRSTCGTEDDGGPTHDMMFQDCEHGEWRSSVTSPSMPSQSGTQVQHVPQAKEAVAACICDRPVDDEPVTTDEISPTDQVRLTT